MTLQEPQPETTLSVADLYPELSAEERKQARQHLDEYLAVVRAVFEERDLTASDPPDTMPML